MPKLTDATAEAVAKAIDNNAKMIHFFKEYDEENKEKQQQVEQQLENFLLGLEELENNPDPDVKVSISEVINLGYRHMIDALRAVKRGYDNKVRNKLIWIIVLTERYKQVRAKYQTIRGFKNLLLLFKTLYTYLIDKHIRLTSLLQDELVMKIKEMSTQTGAIFDQAMRGLIDSEQTVESAKGMVEKSKEMKQEEDLLSSYFFKK